MLSGLKVLEFSEFISGPFCTKMLADLGAEVIKVEIPGNGDQARTYGPFPNDQPHVERSGLYLFLNHNKLGVTLDVRTTKGREIFMRLIKQTDVFVENYPYEIMSSIGLNYTDTSNTNPNLIHCSITPFGRTGPYSDLSGSSIHCCALSGISWAIGSPDREPLEIPLQQSDFQAGINGAAAIMLALLHRHRYRQGQHIDISASDVMANYAGTNSLSYIYYGLKWYRAGRRAYGSGGPYPYGIFPCKDGQVCIIGRSRRDWDNILKALGDPEWGQNERYRDLIKMGSEYADEVDALLIPLLQRYTQAELFAMAEKWGFPLAPVRNIAQALDEPHFKDRGLFEEIKHPVAGTLLFLRPPYQFSHYKAQPVRAAPLLGEHNELVFGERYGISLDELDELKREEVI